jgi:dienelactone hydrolase
MFGKMIANTMIKPFQSPLFDNPKTYGLDYEDVTFEASDGVSLSGWLIKGSKDKVIIQSHFGVQCCRAGYTLQGKTFLKGYDRDIKFLRQAKYLNEAGYTVLMYDFRNHGQSGQGTIPWIAWGSEEAKDVVAAVDFLANHEVYKNASIGLFSICMGQGAATAAFGLEKGLKNYSNIKCMVSIQPMDYPTFIDALGMPKFLANSTSKVIRKRTGMDFNESSWVPNVKDITIPVLVIQNKNDGYLNEDFVNKYYEDLIVEKEMLWIDIPKKKNANFNRIAAYEWIGENPAPILGWFEKYV